MHWNLESFSSWHGNASKLALFYCWPLLQSCCACDLKMCPYRRVVFCLFHKRNRRNKFQWSNGLFGESPLSSCDECSVLWGQIIRLISDSENKRATSNAPSSEWHGTRGAVGRVKLFCRKLHSITFGALVAVHVWPEIDVSVVADKSCINDVLHTCLCFLSVVVLFFSALASPSMRGATPLDVAAASLMDNNELALALREPDLEKVSVYRVRKCLSVMCMFWHPRSQHLGLHIFILSTYSLW